MIATKVGPRLAALAALAILAAASPARADDPVVVRHPPSSVRVKLIAGGLLVAGAPYGLGYLCATQWPETPGADALKIPVVGPWISLGQAGCAADDPDCGFSLYLRGFLTVIDGLMQLGGLGIVGEGIFMTTESEGPPARRAAWAGGPIDLGSDLGVVIQPVPVLTPHSTGIGFAGTF